MNVLLSSAILFLVLQDCVALKLWRNWDRYETDSSDAVHKSCAMQQIGSLLNVQVVVVLFNYCYGTSTQKQEYLNDVPNIHGYLQTMFGSEQIFSKWTLKNVNFRSASYESCQLPSQYDFVENASDFVIQVNLLLPYYNTAVAKAAKKTAKSVRGDLRCRSSSYTISICAMNYAGIQHFCDYTEAYLNIYVPTIHSYIVAPDYKNVANVNTANFISTFACSNHLLDGQPKRAGNKCNCKCKQGFEIASKKARGCTQYYCKARPEGETRDKCKWLRKCYQKRVTLSSLESYDTCAVQKLFGPKLAADSSTYPWEFDPPEDQNENVRIQLSKKEMVIDEAQYTWHDVKQQKFQIADGITANKSGKFVVSFQLGSKSTCNTTVVLNDAMRPYVPYSVTCPKRIKCRKGWPNYELNMQQYDNVLSGLQSFYDARVNDKCGSQSNCDRRTTKVKCLGDRWYSQYNGNLTWKLLDGDIAFLQTINQDILQDQPGKTLKKCWKHSINLGEPVNNYQCNAPKPSYNSCKDGSSCSLKQCISVSGHEMYSANISIKTSVQQSSNSIAAQLNLPNINSARDIHLVKPHDAPPGWAEFNLSSKISILFNSTSLAQHSSIQFDNLHGHGGLSSIVKCKFMFSLYGTWKPWEINDMIRPTADTSNSVVIECWSKIGKVAEQSFDIFLHESQETFAPICDDFAKSSFYQTIALSNQKEDILCNVVGSDFSEIAFDFKYNMYSMGSAKFENMTCSAYYMSASGSGSISDRISDGVVVINTTDPKSRILERFAIQLKTNTTDVATMMEFNCQIWYATNTGLAVENSCRKVFHFDDCDAPLFDSPAKIEAKQLENCPIQEEQPKSLCFGKQLRLDNSSGIPHIDFKHLDQGCCNTDQTKYQCVPISGLKELGWCDVPLLTNHMEAYAKEALKNAKYLWNVATIFLFFACVFIGKKVREQHGSQHMYSRPLLQ